MADVKQYVNIDPTKPDLRKELAAKQVGRNVVVAATVSPKKPGIWVYFEMKSTAKNIVPSLEDANFSADKLKHLKGRVGGLPGTSTRCAKTDAKGVARLVIKLSEFGGDEFTVEAYVKGKKGKKKTLQSDKLIVWRRMYYQVSRFKGGPKGAGRTGVFLPVPTLTWPTIKTEFEAREHNIEMVDESSKDLITRRANVVNTEDEDVLKKSAREGYDPKNREPLVMRVVLVNQLASPAEAWLQQIVTVGEDAVVTVTAPNKLWVDESLPRTEDWAIEAEWHREKGDPWEPLDRKYLRRLSINQFTISFGDIKKKGFFDWFRKVRVRIKLRYLDGSTNGLSWYNTIWLAAENMHKGARTPDAKLQTAIHESGHYIGMVPAGQSTQYTGHDHTGGHCNTGLSAAEKAGAHYGGLSGTCVMFGENADSRTGHFCGECDKSVRTRTIIKTAMPASWV